jgi:lipid-binding SYLF domain-containing protein
MALLAVGKCGLCFMARIDYMSRDAAGWSETCRFADSPLIALKLMKPYDWWARPLGFDFDGGRRFMRKIMPAVMALALMALPAFGAGDKKEAARLENAGTVLEEIMNIPDDVPQDLLDKAECVVIFPSVLKFAIGIGGSYGRGAMVCRSGEHFTGPWGAPSMAALEGGSFGFQLGGQATDFLLLIMNPRGATAILNNKVKLGADAAAAAGPKGRNAAASTDVTLRAEILSYSRSRGLFAGISLEGSTLRPDNDANERVYGKKLDASDIVLKGVVPVPASARKMDAILNKKSPKNTSDPNSLK